MDLLFKEVYDKISDNQEKYFSGDFIEFESLFFNGFIMSQLYYEIDSFFNDQTLENSRIKFNKTKFAYTFEHIKRESNKYCICFIFDKEYINDGYNLSITKEKIYIKSANKRGFIYALEQLNSLIVEYGDKFYLPVLETSNIPKVRFRGVIEGFYGKPYDQEERLDSPKFLHSVRLNCFFYAPKDDPYHRENWRVSYPEEALSNLKEIIDECKKHEIDFFYGISPGNDINICNANEMLPLAEKFQQVIDLGINKFVLLLDDVEYHLKSEEKTFFEHNGIAHGHFINKTFDLLKTMLSEFVLMACPTEYMQDFDTQYKMDINRIVYPEIPFIWTGPSIMPSEIKTSSCKLIAEIYKGREIALWDNYPCNDYTDKSVLSLSPYLNRGNLINHVGVIANTAMSWELSKLTLYTMGKYLWNPPAYDPVQAALEYVEACIFYKVKEHISQDEIIVLLSHLQDIAYGSPIPFHLKRAIEENDFETIEKESILLYNIAEKIINSSCMEQEIFIKTKPWLDRVLAEHDFLLKFKSNIDVTKEYNDLSTDLITLSSNFVLKFYEDNIKN